jgi:hypothetical protein
MARVTEGATHRLSRYLATCTPQLQARAHDQKSRECQLTTGRANDMRPAEPVRSLIRYAGVPTIRAIDVRPRIIG